MRQKESRKMNKPLTEEELKEVLRNAAVHPDKSFFDDNYGDVTPPLCDDPTIGERWNHAMNTRYEVYPNDSVGRMEISVKQGTHLLCKVYQDATDGCIYPTEEGGEPYSDEIKDKLVEMDAAFDGTIENPAAIIGFVEGMPSSEVECQICESEESDIL